MAGDEQRQLFFDLFTAKAGRPALERASGATSNAQFAREAFHSSTALRPEAQQRPKNQTYSVRDLIVAIRSHIEDGFSGLVSVEGEVSNCRLNSSGHAYFTLKDGEAQLPVVMFRQKVQLARFRPRDGLAVKVRGRISLYEVRGQLQLIADWVQEQGTGALQQAFEELRTRLLAEGLFSREKRALPAYPSRIGVITSISGAVLQDIVHVVRRRHARLDLLIYPATMQGEQCAKEVSAAIRYFNRHADQVELILIARGGGSFEDLAGFNNEELARLIAGSSLPVVSAVGHETDTTIADFVADLRAPTPSAAAELITAAQERLGERLQLLEERVQRAAGYQMMLLRRRLERLAAGQVLRRVQDLVERRAQRLDEMEMRLPMLLERFQRRQRAGLEVLEARLRAYDPRLKLVSMRHRLELWESRLEAAVTACMTLKRGRINRWDHGARERDLLAAATRARVRLRDAELQLNRTISQVLLPRRGRVARLVTRLEDLSPFAVLQRGYAIAYDVDGRVLRKASDVELHQQVRVRLYEGSVRSTVIEVEGE